MVKTILIVLVAEIWVSVGHLLLKTSTNAIEFHSLRALDAKLRFLKNVIVRPTLWLGIMSIAIGFIAWIFALASADLSVVYPMSSIAYIIVLFSAHFFLGEKIDKMKLIGTFFVAVGIILITMS